MSTTSDNGHPNMARTTPGPIPHPSADRARVRPGGRSDAFPDFNPLVRVPEASGRVDGVGNVYQQLIGLGPVRLTTRWETVSVDPPNLGDRPRPAPPWTTIEVGRLPLLGHWRSTSRYHAVDAATLVIHDLDYQLPAGTI